MLERLGEGGSARLAPLIARDGIGLVRAGVSPVHVGDPDNFLPSEAIL